MAAALKVGAGSGRQRGLGLAGRYAPTAVFFHWLVAALLALQFPLGWLMQQIAKEPPGVRAEAFNLHKSLGLVLLALIVARLAWRASHPPAPLALPRWQWRLALGNHALLYAVVFCLALTGYLGSAVSGYPVRFFGLPLPAWAPRDEAWKAILSTMHLALSWLLAAAVALHVAGALSHTAKKEPGFSAP